MRKITSTESQKMQLITLCAQLAMRYPLVLRLSGVLSFIKCTKNMFKFSLRMPPTVDWARMSNGALPSIHPRLFAIPSQQTLQTWSKPMPEIVFARSSASFLLLRFSNSCSHRLSLFRILGTILRESGGSSRAHLIG